MTLLTAVKDVFLAFFPFFAEMAKQGLEDCLTSPYFITGVILFILSSGFGIWVGKTGGKLIYLIVSILIAVLSLVSIGAMRTATGPYAKKVQTCKLPPRR